MLAALAPDRLTVEEEPSSRTPIITTLYDLMAALHAASAPGEEDLVTAAVVDLCLDRTSALPGSAAHPRGRLRLTWVCTRETRGHERLHNIFRP